MNILVTHRTNIDKHGKVEYVPAKPLVQRVTARYSNGTVRTSSGDVWDCIPWNQGNVQLLAVVS